MLRRTLPASVSPCQESQACLHLVDSKNKSGGGSRAGERDRTCSSPPLPPRCPNTQHRNEAEPVLCTRGAAASTRHPGDRREGLRPRMLLRDVAGARLPGSLRGLCKENCPRGLTQRLGGLVLVASALRVSPGRPGWREAPREALLHSGYG